MSRCWPVNTSSVTGEIPSGHISAGLITVGDQMAVSLAPVTSYLSALDVLIADFAALLPGGRLPHVDDAALLAAYSAAAGIGSRRSMRTFRTKMIPAPVLVTQQAKSFACSPWWPILRHGTKPVQV